MYCHPLNSSTKNRTYRINRRTVPRNKNKYLDLYHCSMTLLLLKVAAWCSFNIENHFSKKKGLLNAWIIGWCNPGHPTSPHLWLRSGHSPMTGSRTLGWVCGLLAVRRWPSPVWVRGCIPRLRIIWNFYNILLVSTRLWGIHRHYNTFWWVLDSVMVLESSDSGGTAVGVASFFCNACKVLEMWGCWGVWLMFLIFGSNSIVKENNGGSQQ